MRKGFLFFLLLLILTSSPLAASEPPHALPDRDGNYTVEGVLKGGTGRVQIVSPISISVADGKATATIIWTSSYYEYMIIGDVKYLPDSKGEDTTTFRIPITSLDPIPLVAQTTKMSKPYDIEYRIVFDAQTLKGEDQGINPLFFLLPIAFLILLVPIFFLKKNKRGRQAFCFLAGLTLLTFSSCGEQYFDDSAIFPEKPDIGIPWMEKEEIRYAKGFAVDYYEKDVALIRSKEFSYLVLPKNTAPEDLGIRTENLKPLIVIRRPERIYLAAPSVMAFLHDIEKMDKIKYSGTKKEAWELDYAVEAMERGDVRFSGRYSSPDFETLVKEGCDLAVFSTMITHVPEVSEKLEEVHIPVFTDYSSYEPHPLGRTEWIKTYGAIFGVKEKAREIFDEQARQLEAVIGETESDRKPEAEKTVAFFYFTSSGKISARRYDDYVSRMIEIAGGKYAYHDVSDAKVSALSIIMEPEIFFKETEKAEIILYNSTISGGFDTIEQMVEQYPILKDMNAVKNRNVWMTKRSFYQSSTHHGNMIVELNQIISGNAEEDRLQFFTKLK